MAPTAKDTLFGGRKLTLDTLESSQREVTVRQIRMSELPLYRKVEHDEFTRLELVTGLSADELDALTPESFEAALEADGEVNGPLARRQEAREAKAQARDLAQMRDTMPEVYERAVEATTSQLVKMMPGSGSSNVSPESSPVAESPGSV